MKEVPGTHQTERVVAGHDQMALGNQHAFRFSKNRVWIFFKFNYMRKYYNVDTIRSNGHRAGVASNR